MLRTDGVLLGKYDIIKKIKIKKRTGNLCDLVENNVFNDSN